MGCREITEFVNLKWKKKNGKIIEKQIELKAKLPKGFWNGDDVIFNINDNDGVTVSFRIADAPLYEIDSSRNKVDYGDSSGI